MSPRWLITLLLLLLVFAPVMGQDESGTQTYLSYDGWLRFDYPVDWVVDREGDDVGLGLFTVGSSQAALDVLRRNNDIGANDPVPDGDVAIIIMRPELLARLTSALGPDGSLPDILKTVVTGADDDEISIVETTVAGYPAVRLDASDDVTAGSALVIQFERGVNILLFASSTPDAWVEFEQTVQAIAETVRYGGQAEAVLTHDYRVSGAIWNADGSRIRTRETDFSSGASRVRIWDSSTFEELFRVEVSSDVFSPDGTKLLVTTSERIGRMLDVDTGAVLFEISPISSPTWNTAGTQILTTSDADSLVAVWDATTGERLVAIEYAVSTAQWAEDDTQILTRKTGEGAEVIYWDAATGEQLSVTPGTLAATVADDRVRRVFVEDATTLVMAALPSGDEIWRSQIARDDDRFYEIRFPRETDDGTRVNALIGSCPPSNNNCTLRAAVWDAETGEALFVSPTGDEFRVAVFLENGQIAAGLRGPDLIKVWDANTGAEVASLQTSSFVYRTLLSPDEDLLFVFEDSGIIRVFDTATWRSSVALPHDARVETGVIEEENPDHFVVRTEDGSYIIWDLTSGRELLRIGHAPRGSTDVSISAILSPDGSRLLTFASGDYRVRVFPYADMLVERRALIATEAPLLAELESQATAALNSRDFEGAIRLLSEALRIDPDGAVMLNDRAIAHYRTGNAQAAVNDLVHALRLDPMYVQGLRNLGDILRLEGNSETAIEYYTRGIEINPNIAPLHNSRGVANANLERFELAAEDFAAAIAVDPNYAQAYINRAFILSFIDRNAEALASLENYIALVGETNLTANETALLARLREATD
jgi:WD40 repeat protein/Flp pilus assembly protein TadD